MQQIAQVKLRRENKTDGGWGARHWTGGGQGQQLHANASSSFIQQASASSAVADYLQSITASALHQPTTACRKDKYHGTTTTLQITNKKTAVTEQLDDKIK